MNTTAIDAFVRGRGMEFGSGNIAREMSSTSLPIQTTFVHGSSDRVDVRETTSVPLNFLLREVKLGLD